MFVSIQHKLSFVTAWNASTDILFLFRFTTAHKLNIDMYLSHTVIPAKGQII